MQLQVLIEEVRSGDWLCGGVNMHAHAIPCIVMVKVPAGVLDEQMRKDYVLGLHQAIEQCVGKDDGRMLMTSIQLVDIADGTWGANGRLWHLADFTRAAGYRHLLARTQENMPSWNLRGQAFASPRVVSLCARINNLSVSIIEPVQTAV